MRGKKGSEYDGGHRVPFFLHWPAGGYTAGRDIDTLIANIDFLPTLCDLCGVPIDDEAMARINGASVKPLLDSADNWPDRVLVTDSQRVETPIKWRKCATMTQRWRLVNGDELYDRDVDPEQRHNVADRHPQSSQSCANTTRTGGRSFPNALAKMCPLSSALTENPSR